MANILVVDDRQANRAYLSTLLRARGYRTLEAADGVEALEVLQAQRPDLVLVDILMPRMDGYEFVRRVRADEAVARTPIILLTAHYRADQAHALTDGFGVTHILAKPIEPEAVLTSVEQALQSGREAAAGRAPAGPVAGADAKSAPGAAGPMSPASFKEEHRRLLTDTLAQKASQLEVANDRLRGLVNLGRRLAAERDPRRLLSLFVTSAGELVGSEYALLAIADYGDQQAESADEASAAPDRKGAASSSPSTPTIKHILANGRDPAVVGRISSAGPVTQLLRQFGDVRSGVRVPVSPADADAKGLPSSSGAALAEPFRALAPELIIAPIATASRFYGLIVFGGLPQHLRAAADESIKSLAQSMGAVLGVAYENALRYEQIDHHARRLQDEIAERRLAEERVARLNAELEQRVADRTAELQRSHERLRQSERMASLGTLCAGLGHDMGNLLLPIRVRLDLIEEHVTGEGSGVSAIEQSESESEAPVEGEGETCRMTFETVTDATLNEHVEAIRRCIQYIGDLTNGLRLLSLDPEDENNQPPVTDLGEWWEQVQPLMRSALPRRIELETSMPDKPIKVRLARHRLTQAVFNLVQNAGDAMRLHQSEPEEASGRVLVSVQLKANDKSGADAEADACILSISDDGPGMSESVRRRAIEPFFTTKSRGLSTGLGLSLVHGIVKSSNGTLDIASAEGNGTTVAMTLPLASAQQPGDPQAAPRKPGAADDRPQRSAVVSIDHPRMKALCVSMLDVMGFRVSCIAAEDVQRALEESSEESADQAAMSTGDIVWVTEASAAPAESIRRFMAGGTGRRVALLGEADDSSVPSGCTLLGANPTAASLRSELRRLFGRKGERSTPTPAGSEVA